MNALDEFEWQLSSYVMMQFRSHLSGHEVRPKVRYTPPEARGKGGSPTPHSSKHGKRGRDEWFESLSFSEWLSFAIGKLTSEIADTLWTKEELPRSLNIAELRRLQSAAEDAPIRFDGLLIWQPWVELHERAVDCVPFLRQHLTAAVAGDWVNKSQRWSKRLRRKPLRTAEGIEVVTDWLVLLQRLRELASEKKASVGSSKTTAEKVKNEEAKISKLLDRLRAEFEKNPNRRSQKAITLRKFLKVRNADLRKALRILKETGEYVG